MVEFKCTLCGVCCSRYWVPVTHLDVWRISYYGDYKPNGFLKLFKVGCYKSSMPKVPVKEGEGYLGLRRFANGLCTFNLNRLCTVHAFKPLTCRFYPFVYVTSGGRVVRVDVNKDAVGVCLGLKIDGKPIEPRLYSHIMRLAEARLVEKRLYAKAVEEWVSESSGKWGFEELVEFMLERAGKDAAQLARRGLWVK